MISPRFLGSVSLAFALLACGDSEREAKQCSTRMDHLEAALASVPLASTPAPGVNGFQAPRASGGSAPRIAPFATVGVAPDTLLLDWRVMDAPEELSQDIATLERNWSILHGSQPWPNTVNVWADARAPMSRLTALASGPLAGRRIEVLALGTRATSLPPCPSSLGDYCARTTSRWSEAPAAEAHATATAEALERAVATCPPLILSFAAMAGASEEDRTTFLREHVPAEARQCGCSRLDVERLEYLVLEVGGAHEEPVSTFELTGEVPPDMTVAAWIASRAAP